MCMETFDGLQAPGLAFLSVGFGPENRLPIRSKDQSGSGIGKFHPVAGGFPDIEEERALDGVLVRTGFDENTVFQEYVGRTQDVLALIRGIGNVVQSSVAAAMFFGAGKVVGFVVDRKPTASEAAIVELDVLGDACTEAGDHEISELGNIIRQEIEVVETTWAGTVRMEPACVILQGRSVCFAGAVFDRVPVNFENMAKRVLEPEVKRKEPRRP